MEAAARSISIGRARVVAGLVGLAVTAGYMVTLAQLPFGSVDQPGAAVFPAIVSVVLLVASLVTIFDGRRMLRVEDDRADLPAAAPLLKMTVLLVTLIFYALTLPLLGRLIGTFLATLVILMVFSERSRIWPLLHAVWITAFVWIVFIRLFALPLPRGVILDL